MTNGSSRAGNPQINRDDMYTRWLSGSTKQERLRQRPGRDWSLWATPRQEIDHHVSYTESASESAPAQALPKRAW